LTFGQPYEILAQVTVEGQEVPGQVFALDEDLCIRCGLCENSCPTGALAMKSFEYREVAVRPKRREDSGFRIQDSVQRRRPAVQVAD
jgi:ferredoxin